MNYFGYESQINSAYESSYFEFFYLKFLNFKMLKNLHLTMPNLLCGVSLMQT